LPVHLLGAARTCRHVTVQTGLVASVTEIGLQGFEPSSRDRREIALDQQGKGVAHGWAPSPCRPLVGACTQSLHPVSTQDAPLAAPRRHISPSRPETVAELRQEACHVAVLPSGCVGTIAPPATREPSPPSPRTRGACRRPRAYSIRTGDPTSRRL